MRTVTMIGFLRIFLLIGGLWGGAGVLADQVADKAFAPTIADPSYPSGTGPVVCIDEGHFNFHTAEGRFEPFARLLREDGYVVKPLKQTFAEASLRECAVLVIANALAERNRADWSLPTPSAFMRDETGAVERWVREGGAVLLIADHMPFAGAADELAKAFGITYINGYVLKADSGDGTLIFSRDSGSLVDHPISRGQSADKRVNRVVSFTGSALSGPTQIEPLLRLDGSSVALMPTTAGQFSAWTPRKPVDGWLQGGVLSIGQGRLAAFAEAGMFTAQLTGAERRPMGMNAPEAKENAQFLLNLMRWLTQGLRNTNK